VKKCLFTNECAKNIYIHPCCEEAVYRASIQIVQTTDGRNSVAIARPYQVRSAKNLVVQMID